MTTPKLDLMLRAAGFLRSPAGAHAAGWADGFQGREPSARRYKAHEFVDAYESGWLAGAEAALGGGADGLTNYEGET